MACVSVIHGHGGFGYKFVTKHDGHHQGGHHAEHSEWNVNGGYNNGYDHGHQDYHVINRHLTILLNSK